MAVTSNASLSPEALPFIVKMDEWVRQAPVMAALRAAQAEAAEAFAALDERLSGYKPAKKLSLLGRLFGDKIEAVTYRPD